MKGLFKFFPCLLIISTIMGANFLLVSLYVFPPRYIIFLFLFLYFTFSLSPQKGCKIRTQNRKVKNGVGGRDERKPASKGCRLLHVSCFEACSSIVMYTLFI